MDIARTVAPGLFLAWLANDVEELATMRPDSALTLRAASRALPIPRELAARGLAQGHITTAISIMGGVMAAAAIDGARSQGRGRLFQTVLLGFGLHGVGHLGQAALARRWTSGARTSPTVVIPFWIWASRALARNGTSPVEAVAWPAVAGMPLILGAVHAAAWALRRAAGIRRPLLDER